MTYGWQEGRKKRGQSVAMDIKCKAFAHAYIELADETQAAIKVGYKVESARKKGQLLLKDGRVQAQLQKLYKLATKKDIATIEWRRETLQRIAETHADTANGTAIAAIAELNKMDGAYAATRVESKNLNIDADLALVKKLVEEYKQEY